MAFESTWTIRPMCGRDLRHVVLVEEQSFPDPWQASDFHDCLQDPEVEAFVAVEEATNATLGFLVARHEEGELHMTNMAVHPRHRRGGMGTDLVEHLLDRADRRGAGRARLEVRESNLDAQLFYRAVGFKASGIRRSFYADTGEDAYVMERPLEEDATLEWRGIIG